MSSLGLHHIITGSRSLYQVQEYGGLIKMWNHLLEGQQKPSTQAALLEPFYLQNVSRTPVSTFCQVSYSAHKFAER